METKDNEIFEMPGKKKTSNFYFQKGINDLLLDSRIWMKSKKSLQNLDNKVCKADEEASNMEEKKNIKGNVQKRNEDSGKEPQKCCKWKTLMDQKSKNTVEKLLTA